MQSFVSDRAYANTGLRPPLAANLVRWRTIRCERENLESSVVTAVPSAARLDQEDRSSSENATLYVQSAVYGDPMEIYAD